MKITCGNCLTISTETWRRIVIVFLYILFMIYEFQK